MHIYITIFTYITSLKSFYLMKENYKNLADGHSEISFRPKLTSTTNNYFSLTLSTFKKIF